MSRKNKLTRANGFTLVEMLIIAPIALLVIGGFIALMVVMVGDVIAGRARNVMTYDIQSALSTIEQDVRLTTQFLATSGTLPSPQGKDGSTAAFTSTGGDLVLGEIATDKNPIDPLRSFIHYDTPFSCSEPKEVYKNRLFFTTVAYFVRDGSLWRRTYVPTPSGTLCDSPWQVNSCAPGYPGSATQCQSNDSEILKDVSEFEVEYFEQPEHTSSLNDAAATSASSIRVTIESQSTSAGRSIAASFSGRSTKLSSQDIALAPPDVPVVASSASGNEAVFSWPSVANATSYIVRYSITKADGTVGPWITASENTTETSFAIAAGRKDTVSIKVFARNATGSSIDGTSNNASIEIPLWTPCALQNGWTNYGGVYETCGYTITKDGVVVLKGLIRNTSTPSNTRLFQLPDNLSPADPIMFQAVNNPDTGTRLDIYSNGGVHASSSVDATYLSLDGAYFIPKNSLYTWTAPSLQNGWTNYNVATWSSLGVTQDASNRVHIKGLLQQGTYSSGTVIADLPAGLNPSETLLVPARSDVYNLMQLFPAGTITTRGISSYYYATQTMFYPSSYGGWQNLTPVAGNPGNNQIGNGWVAYGGAHATPQFTKSADGIVTVKGLIKDGSTTNGRLLVRLPAGYRPRNSLTFSVPMNSGAGRIDIDSNGYIISRSTDSTWTSLSGISFVAEL